MARENYPADFNTAQSGLQPAPTTIASAATIMPTQKFTRITGTVPITKIVPVDPGGYCELTFIFSTAYATAFNTGVATQGGIGVAYDSVLNRPIDLCYDPRTGLWYPKAVV